MRNSINVQPKTDSNMNRLSLTFISVAIAIEISAGTLPTDSTRSALAQDSIYKQLELKGVTIAGRTAIQKGDHTAYMPTKQQADAANSGISLLANMMIPKLVVDRVNGTVTDVNNSTPTIYIDNRKADATEADRLRPKDIVRVEYYDHPSADFPGEQSVLNFITRKYDRGGYVDVRTTTEFYTGLYGGNYSAQVGMDFNRLNITLMGGTGFSREDAGRTGGTEHYAFATPLTKQTTVTDRLTKQRVHYGKLRMTYRTDKTTAYADFSLNWSETPTDRLGTLVNYRPQAYPGATATTTTHSRNAAPRAALFMETKLGKGQTLRAQAYYVYGDNTYRREYAEGALAPVLTDTKEKRNGFGAVVLYMANLRHNNSITVNLFGFNDWSKTNYVGTIAAAQEIQDGGLIFLPNYTHTFAKKLSISVQPGLFWERYYIRGFGTTSRLRGRPVVSASYSINSKNLLYANWAMGSSVPTMDKYNNTEQRVNQYTVKRGNPDLEIIKLYDINAGYNLTLKNVNVALFGYYSINTDDMKEYYTTEGETLVSSYISDGTSHYYNAGASVTWGLLGRSLQLSGRLAYRGQHITGINSAHDNRMVFSLGADYYVKGFAFSARYSSKFKEVIPSGWMEIPERYYFLASWNYKGLYAEIGCQQIFNRNFTERRWFDFGAYSYSTENLQKSMCSAWVRLSYSFDFGRKKVERTKLEVQKGSSGIMKL